MLATTIFIASLVFIIGQQLTYFIHSASLLTRNFSIYSARDHAGNLTCFGQIVVILLYMWEWNQCPAHWDIKLGGWFEIILFLCSCFSLWNSFLILYLYIPYVLVFCDFTFVCLEIFSKFLFEFLDLLLFKRVLPNFYIFVNSPVFLLLLISSFIPLWVEKILAMI